MFSRIITALIVVLFAGCASIHETRTINKDGSVTVEKSASGWGVGVPAYGYPYGTYGTSVYGRPGDVVIEQRHGANRPELHIRQVQRGQLITQHRYQPGYQASVQSLPMCLYPGGQIREPASGNTCP